MIDANVLIKFTDSFGDKFLKQLAKVDSKTILYKPEMEHDTKVCQDTLAIKYYPSGTSERSIQRYMKELIEQFDKAAINAPVILVKKPEAMFIYNDGVYGFELLLTFIPLTDVEAKA